MAFCGPVRWWAHMLAGLAGWAVAPGYLEELRAAGSRTHWLLFLLTMGAALPASQRHWLHSAAMAARARFNGCGMI